MEITLPNGEEIKILTYDKESCANFLLFEQLPIAGVKQAIIEAYNAGKNSQQPDPTKQKDAEIEKLIKETITTLEHARIFIKSKSISMHPDGIRLYDENIEALRKIAYTGNRHHQRCRQPGG